VWTDEEIKLFLALIKENNLTAILDGKQQRNSTIYQDRREMMLLKGYDKECVEE
jgi:transposase-like protein